MSRGHKRARREPIGWKEHREQGWANEGDAEHVLRETHAVEEHRNTRTQDGNSKHKTQKTQKNQGKETKADFFYNAWQVIALKLVFPPPLAKGTDWISQISFNCLCLWLLRVYEWVMNDSVAVVQNVISTELHNARDSPVSYRYSSARSPWHILGI